MLLHGGPLDGQDVLPTGDEYRECVGLGRVAIYTKLSPMMTVCGSFGCDVSRLEHLDGTPMDDWYEFDGVEGAVLNMGGDPHD